MQSIYEFCKAEEIAPKTLISFLERTGLKDLHLGTMLSDTVQQSAIDADLPKIDFCGTFAVNTAFATKYVLIKGAGNHKNAQKKMEEVFGKDFSMIYEFDNRFQEDIDKFKLVCMTTLYCK